MLFNSLIFIFFLICTLFFYYLLPHRFRWMLLLAASLVFYAAWNPRLLFLLLFTVFVNYAAALLIVRYPLRKKWILMLAVIINFGILMVFKYANFFADSLRFLLTRIGLPAMIPELHVILPMGISFYTFQAVGYTVDVYRQDLPAERNYCKLTLFITFFPQLVAGPIERASNLMPQLFTQKHFSAGHFITGMKYILFGFFKKIVIADRIAAAVNTVYNNPTHYAGLPAVITTFLFAFQIYCDFSGYSDIAIGCAKMLGIELMQNFKQPYLSKGIREFWRRWHISLSTWFKDYVYFPLGGSRVSKPRHYLNTMITFLVSGLWHGANWTFVLWGAVHGLFQIAGDALGYLFARGRPPESAKGKARDGFDRVSPVVRCVNMLKVIFTFLLVCFTWIFFRANSIGDALFITGHLFSDAASWGSPQYIYDVLNNMGMQLLEIIVGVGAILLMSGIELYSGQRTVHDALMKTHIAVRWLIYAVITMAILSTGVFGGANAFIYFQF